MIVKSGRFFLNTNLRLLKRDNKMLKLKCKKCGEVGYSASEETRCACGGKCEHILNDKKIAKELINIFLLKFLTL